MAIRLLIDECLSPTLEGAAHDMGYEAVHLNHGGWSGVTDPLLFQQMIEESFTLVTHNQEDLAPPTESLEAYELSLQATVQAKRWMDPDAQLRAIKLLERAVQLDREFAQTRARLDEGRTVLA